MNTDPRPKSATRWLPWLLIPLIAIPLVRSCVRTSKPADTAVDSATTLPAADTIRAVPESGSVTKRVAPASSATKPGGKKVDKVGGVPAPQAPAGDGAMGGEGPTGKQ